MKIHELKTDHAYWWAVERGDKPFEVRKNDRDFAVGDVLNLRVWTKESGFHDLNLLVEVTYVLHGGRFGLEEGYCVLGTARLKVRP